MGTTLKAELSLKNRHHLGRHRYYELKHFCLQYDSWKEALSEITELEGRGIAERIFSSEVSDPTPKIAELKTFYKSRIEMIERAAIETDPNIAEYILIGVTNGKPYDKIYASLDIPCSRQEYYKLYREFFYRLSAIRQ